MQLWAYVYYSVHSQQPTFLQTTLLLPLTCLQYGEEAIKEGMGGGGGGGGGMADLFDILSGGGGGRRGQPRERKSEDVVHRLSVSLEELYNGVTK